MNQTNLIPLSRQLRDARRTRARTWSFALGGICGAMAVAYACCVLAPSEVSASPPEAFSKTAAELSKANQESAALRRELAVLREQVQSRQYILQQPDYSLLLGLVSQVVDDDVVLNHCELVNDSQGEQSQAQVLKLGGFARSQPAVAGFMLQIEATGIFRKVTLVRSNEQPLLDRQAAAFQVQCVFGPSGKGAQ